MTVPIKTIQDFTIFSALSTPTQAGIAQAALLREFIAGAMVQLQGDPCEFVGFVHTGSAVIFRMAERGSEQVLSVITPGMHFNTVPAIDPDHALRACIRAIAPLSLLLIPTADFVKLLIAHADLAYLILVDFAHRLDHLIGLVDDLSLHSVRGRLARFLLDQAQGDQVAKTWTQDEIASHLGTVRDVVGRTLRAFIESGLVERQDGKLVLLDRSRLEEETKY